MRDQGISELQKKVNTTIRKTIEDPDAEQGPIASPDGAPPVALKD
jgi:hypothetical protein